MKLKNSNGDKPQNSGVRKTQKLKNLNCDQTQKLKLKQNSKNQILTKLKF